VQRQRPHVIDTLSHAAATGYPNACTYSNNAHGASVQLQVVDPAIGRKVVQPVDSVAGLGDEVLDNNGWLFVRKGTIGLI
jgi:hypothetical protein